jgi:hypothetical protein
MQKLKVGDIVQCLSRYSDVVHKGALLEITSMEPRSDDSYWLGFKGDHDNYPNFPSKKFKLMTIRTPITNDIEWLDRIQENFKYVSD